MIKQTFEDLEGKELQDFHDAAVDSISFAECSLTGLLFPIGIEHLIYMKFFCYGSSYSY